MASFCCASCLLRSIESSNLLPNSSRDFLIVTFSGSIAGIGLENGGGGGGGGAAAEIVRLTFVVGGIAGSGNGCCIGGFSLSGGGALNTAGGKSGMFDRGIAIMSCAPGGLGIPAS